MGRGSKFCKYMVLYITIQRFSQILDVALDGYAIAGLIIVVLGPPPCLADPFIAGRTLEVRSDAGMGPLPAASGATGNPRKDIFSIYCFRASSRLVKAPEY